MVFILTSVCNKVDNRTSREQWATVTATSVESQATLPGSVEVEVVAAAAAVVEDSEGVAAGEEEPVVSSFILAYIM